MNTVILEKEISEKRIFQLVHGDLTQESVDAIVNAANAHLQHGGGVAGAIVRRGGRIIQDESDRWVQQHGAVAHDQPAYTSAGSLPCRYVIHAVGPIWGEGDEDHKLAQAVRGALNLADKLGLSSLALPPISTGIFGFPKERAALIFYQVIEDYWKPNVTSGLKLIRLTIIDQPTLDVFTRVWREKWGQ
ncbi:MAG: macro domain-containing protein [Anaerolineales bacterium]